MQKAIGLRPIKFCPKMQQGYRLAYLSNFALKCNKAIYRLAFSSNCDLKCNKAIAYLSDFAQNATGLRNCQILPQNATRRLAYLSNFALKCNMQQNKSITCTLVLDQSLAVLRNVWSLWSKLVLFYDGSYYTNPMSSLLSFVGKHVVRKHHYSPYLTVNKIVTFV